VDPAHGQCLLRNAKPFPLYAYGGIVPAFGDSHPWREDLALRIAEHVCYARVWDKLWSDTPHDLTPFLLLPNGKWDLTQKNPKYWANMKDIARETKATCIIPEVMIWDRCLGGSNGDYRASPWHPDNNVNGLSGELPDGGLGLELYTKAMEPGTKLNSLTQTYVTWYAEFFRDDCPHCIAEVENENRAVDANNGRDWARRWAKLVKAISPKTVVSFNSLNLETLDKTFGIPEVDIVSVHYGNEGSTPKVFSDFLIRKWKEGKVINFDEFWNNMGAPEVLAEVMKTIEAQGGYGHIEDAKAEALAVKAAAGARAVAGTRGTPKCATGPTGSATCEDEDHRGIAYYRADWNGGSCTGHTDCTKQNAKTFPKGVKVAFDSTPKDAGNKPIEAPCPVLVPTKWTITPTAGVPTGSGFGMQVKFPAADNYTVCAKVDGAGATCLAVWVK
jgi:hypothetical protein